MPEKARRPTTKRAAAKATGKKAATKGVLTRTPKERPPRPKAAEAAPGAKPKEEAPKATARPKAAKYPGPVVRLLFPYDVYDAHKDRIKAEMKDAGLRFQFLGSGQGRYFSDAVSVFAKYGDENVDYTLRGDAATVERLAASWRALGATDFTEEAKAQEEAAEVKAWRLEMPVRRPGEPEGLYRRRLAEWEARKPAAAGSR